MTTPVALVRRLDLVSAALQLEKFDCAIFDEIDTYVTVGDQGERRDTWPALKTCMAAGLPILGFTGTGLSGPQIDKWRSVNFQLVTPEIPDSWLPLTRVRFVPVDDESVVHQDQEIHDRLSDAYRQIVGTHGPIGWAMLKKLAIEGEPVALRILSLSFQRLRLFESFGSADAKLKALVKTLGPGPALMMTRFRDVGHLLAARLNTGGKEARVAEGSMRRGAIEDAIGWFRDQEANQKAVLVLTRELGGRGLDFPHSRCMGLLSPRSNYQAVAQELARIRSRRSSPKEVSILYYARTEEEAKAARLASHLRQERFGERRLFELFNVPKPTYVLEPFESRNLTNEESIRPALGLGSHSFKA